MPDQLGGRKGTAMKKLARFSIVLLALALFGCENGSQVAGLDEALFAKKPSKQCASNGYAFYGLLTWQPVFVDTTSADTVATFDVGYIVSVARACDALYLVNNYGDIFAFDLSNPKHPVQRWGAGYQMELRDLRISGSNLYARFNLCTPRASDYTTVDCVAGTAKWNISDPFNPRLIRLTQDKVATKSPRR
jgi:hypothetical protein